MHGVGAYVFAGPCAQGVLDSVMIPCPMSLGRPGLFVLFKDNAFLGTSTYESVPLAGYLPDTCWILATPRCGSHPRQTLAGSSEIALGRARANLGPTWGELGANWNQLEPISDPKT